MWLSSISDDGKEAVQMLLDHFAPALEEHYDISTIVSEWIKLKHTCILGL